MSDARHVGRTWRLIVHGEADGAANMAIDEAILERYTGPDAPAAPTLRLYGWRPAALSLGRQQRAAGAHDGVFLRAAGIDLVRRPSGGSAVLHENERTYAIVGLLRAAPFPGGVLDTYARVGGALVASLRRLGIDAVGAPTTRDRAPRPVACFGEVGPHEITAGGRKIVGSAQLRRQGAFLQHGSIVVLADPERLARALGVAVEGAGPGDLATAMGRVPDSAEIDRALVEGFSMTFDATFAADALDPREAARAAELRCWKYDSAAWTFEGRIGERERRWGPPLR